MLNGSRSTTNQWLKTPKETADHGSMPNFHLHGSTTAPPHIF